MYLQPLPAYPYSLGSSRLPNIHPQQISCIIRSDYSTKGSLYISNLQVVQNPSTLQKLKANCVITCAYGYKLDYSSELIKYYKYLPLMEISTKGDDRMIQEAVDFVKDSMAKTNVVVHCLTGSTRAVPVVAAYLMKYHSMTYQEAKNFLKKKISFIDVNDTYQLTLKQFEQKIRSQRNQRIQNKTSKRSNSQRTQSYYKTQKSDAQSGHFKITNTQQQANKLNFQNNEENKSKYSRQKSQPKVNQKEYKRQNSKRSINKDLPNNSQLNQSYLSQKNNALSVQHKQAKHFQKILSSSHQQFTGVKRPLKNSTLSQMKAKNSMSQTKANQSSLRIQNFSQKQDSVIQSASRKLITQKSQKLSNSSRLSRSNLANPQQTTAFKKLNESFKLRQSRIQYFNSMNKELNGNIDVILTQYETQTRNVREKYHKRLRDLRVNQMQS